MKIEEEFCMMSTSQSVKHHLPRSLNLIGTPHLRRFPVLPAVFIKVGAGKMEWVFYVDPAG